MDVANEVLTSKTTPIYNQECPILLIFAGDIQMCLSFREMTLIIILILLSPFLAHCEEFTALSLVDEARSHFHGTLGLTYRPYGVYHQESSFRVEDLDLFISGGMSLGHAKINGEILVNGGLETAVSEGILRKKALFHSGSNKAQYL